MGEVATDPRTAVEAARLMRQAQRIVAARADDRDGLAQAALHLVDCASAAVTLLDDRDLEVAREALGHARAAVSAATHALLRIHDDDRSAG